MKQKSKKNIPAKKLDEGFWDTLIGPTAAAGMQAMGKSGMTTREQLVQNIFVKDFVADAVGALSNAIQTGIVNPNVAPGPPPGGGQENPPPTGDQGPTSPGASGTAASPNNPTPTPSSPAGTAVPTGGQRSAPSGTSGAATQPTNSPTQAPPAKRTKQILPNLFGTKQTRQPRATRQPITKENANYMKLNSIFESIIEQQGGQSITKFMQNWFARYMSGINYSQYQNDVNRLIAQVEATYSKDYGKKALTSLAQAAYSISKVAGSIPKDNEASKNTGETQPTTEPAASTTQPVDIDVSTLDDNQLATLLKKLHDEYTARRSKAAPTTTESYRPRKIPESRRTK